MYIEISNPRFFQPLNSAQAGCSDHCVVQNILVCHGFPHWWIKLADFGLSQHRTEEKTHRTSIETYTYVAPEVQNYINGTDPEISEYKSAIDIWALGCIIYRLACGVVLFPPGPKLAEFCRDPYSLIFEDLPMSRLGIFFVGDLVVPHPSHRLTATQARNHRWIKAGMFPPPSRSRLAITNVDRKISSEKLPISIMSWPITMPVSRVLMLLLKAATGPPKLGLNLGEFQTQSRRHILTIPMDACTRWLISRPQWKTQKKTYRSVQHPRRRKKRRPILWKNP